MTSPLPGSPSMRPLLGLAMIVRDGGQFLDSLLAAARPHVDEIVVVDTGSRDGSRDVAARHGARRLDFPWCDDFAAARNAALGACGAAWLLCLDADEQLCPDDWCAVRHQAARWLEDRPAAGRILTRNYVRAPWSRTRWQPVPAPDEHALPGNGAVAPGFVPTWKIRLFPNHPRLRFSGRLHETVEASVHALGLPVVDLPIIVHHFGTLVEDPAKARRYFELARAKTADRPGDAKAWRELADAAVATGQPALGLQAIERALELAPTDAESRLTAGGLRKDAGDLARADAHLLAVTRCLDVSDEQLGRACHLRAQIAMLDGRGEAAGPLLLTALRMIPGDGHVHNSLGVWHLTGGRGEAARAALERAAALLPNLPDPCLNLGRLYEAAGHADLAARHYRQALARDPGRVAADEAVARLAALA